MLLVNLGVFSGAAALAPSHLPPTGALASVLVLLLAEGKFYPLFAFLFGWGLARRQRLACARGRSFFLPNLRRMAVLAAIGLLHAALLWEGDILFVYALAGGLLPLARRLPSWLIAGLAGFGLLLSSLLALPGPGQAAQRAYADMLEPLRPALLAPVSGGSPGGALQTKPGVQAASRDPALFVGPPAPSGPAGMDSLFTRAARSIRARAGLFAWKLAWFPGWLGNFWALILLGWSVGMGRLAPYRPGRAAAALAAAAAVALNLFYALTGAFPGRLPPDWAPCLRQAALSLGGPLLAWVYAAGLLRAWHSPRWRAHLAPLSAPGRVSLSAYLLASLLGRLLFPTTPKEALAPALVWPLAALVFAALALLARAWLSRCTYGPLERAWRVIGG